MKKLGFIGVGNMGGAILKGIEGKLGNTAVFAYDANAEKLADLRLVGATAAGSAREIAEKCDFILLAVKPQHLGEVLAEIIDSGKPETEVISICAGISAEFIRERTIPNAKVVLVMPNTPMMLGCGASAMSHDETVSEDEFAFARKVIGSCGITEVIPTDKMKEIIAVNGLCGFRWDRQGRRAAAVRTEPYRLGENAHRVRNDRRRADKAGILPRRNNACGS